MKTSSVRRFLAVGILSGLGVLLGVGTLLGEGTLSGVKDLSGEPPARAQAAEDTAWFELEGDLAAVWQLTPGQAANTLRIVPRPTSAAEAELGAEALVVFAKRSSAYGIAMNRILKVFGRRKIQISWTLSNSEGELSNATRELRAVERGHYDLVFAMGSDATAWLHQRLEGSATPVVSVCSKDPVLMGLIEDYEGGSGSNFAFTSLNVPVDVQLAYLRTLRPSLSQIALVYTRSNTSTVLTQVDPMVERAEAEGIEIHRVEVLDQDLAREELDWKVQRAVYRMRRQDPDGESSV
ncbi:MAG: ABC transporter substrate binding protein, partial [Acidobacteriota bacterium]